MSADRERLRRGCLGPFHSRRKASNQKVSNDRKLRISESLKVGDPICGKVLGIHNVADPVALYRGS